MKDRSGEAGPALQEQISRTAAAWPELTTDQLTRLAGLFRTAVDA